MRKTKFMTSNLSKVTYTIGDKARVRSEVCLGFTAKEKRDELPGNMHVDFYMKTTIRSILSNTQKQALAFSHKADVPFSGHFSGAASEDARTKLSMTFSGKLCFSCPTGARQAFFRQNSRTKVLTVAATQNVALASQSNNYLASF